jgi:Na+-driven multidrug efflux pump
MKDKTTLILNSKKIMKSLLLLSLPIMASNILKSLHDIVDMYFVSNIEGTKEAVEAQVSAITVTGPIIMICQALALGLMVAGSALMSQYIGAKNIAKAKKVSGHLLLLCITIGVLFNLLLYFLAPSILIAMGSEVGTELFTYSVYYVRYRSFELIGLFVLFSFQATRQSTGDTVTPVILNVVTVVLNIILTFVLIKLFGMDIRGAALATVIANMIIIPFLYIHDD